MKNRRLRPSSVKRHFTRLSRDIARWNKIMGPRVGLCFRAESTLTPPELVPNGMAWHHPPAPTYAL